MSSQWREWHNIFPCLWLCPRFFLEGWTLRLAEVKRVSTYGVQTVSKNVFVMSSTFWGPHSTMDSIIASHPAALGSILGASVPRFIKHCLVSGQWHSDQPEVGVLKSSGSVCQASATKKCRHRQCLFTYIVMSSRLIWFL